MASETAFRTTALILLLGLLAMQFYFMVWVHRSGRRIMPDKWAVVREGDFDFRFVQDAKTLLQTIQHIPSARHTHFP